MTETIPVKDQAPGRNMELVVSRDGGPVLRRELRSSELVVGDSFLLPGEEDVDVRIHWAKGWWVTARTAELRLDGHLCPVDIPQRFGAGHHLDVADYTLTIQRRARRSTSDRDLSSMPRKDALRVVVDGRRVEVFGAERRIVIGSSPGADVQVPAAAPRHAELSFDGQQWHVEDVGGTSSVRIEGQTVGYSCKEIGMQAKLEVAGTLLLLERCVDERFEGLFGDSDAVQTLRRDLGKACEASCVLLLTETGLYPDTIARAVHEASARYSGGDFGQVNCGDLGTTLESELCGHVKGAFTDAVTERDGLLQLCHGGTVFLDSVQHYRPSAQARLLRILQERAYRKIGSEREIGFDCQIIASAPPMAELERAIEQGVIRADFFARLSSECVVSVPPLRERGNDGVAWARRRLANEATETRRLTLEPDGEDAIRRATWLGNFQGLDQAIDQVCLDHKKEGHRGIGAAELNLPDESEDSEVQQLRDALRACAGNRRAAARQLGCSPRTVDRRIKQFGLQAFEREVRQAANAEDEARIRGAIRDAKGDKAAAAKVLGIPADELHARAGEMLRKERERHEREALEAAFREERGNVSATARRLGLARMTVENRLRKYGLKG